jgi:hypothetical protein
MPCILHHENPATDNLHHVKPVPDTLHHVSPIPDTLRPVPCKGGSAPDLLALFPSLRGVGVGVGVGGGGGAAQRGAQRDGEGPDEEAGGGEDSCYEVERVSLLVDLVFRRLDGG